MLLSFRFADARIDTIESGSSGKSVGLGISGLRKGKRKFRHCDVELYRAALMCDSGVGDPTNGATSEKNHFFEYSKRFAPSTVIGNV